MGGNALESVKVERVTTEKLHIIYKALRPTLLEYFDSVMLPKLLFSKKDHGDVDILVSCKNDVHSLPFDPKVLFKANEVADNGDVHSFDYENAQIDIIICKHIKMAYYFYSYGDLGMIQGFLLKRWGVKFSSHGVWYRITDDPSRDTYLWLTADPELLCRFLGLNYEKWAKGMESFEEMFSFLEGCQYFKACYYKDLKGLENNNHRRKLQRNMYKSFIEWFTVKAATNDESNNNAIDLVAMEKKFRDDILAAFSVTLEYNEITEKIRLDLHMRKRLNGKRIMSVLELGPSPLIKNIMADIRSFGEEILKWTEQELDAKIKEIHEKHIRTPT